MSSPRFNSVEEYIKLSFSLLPLGEGSGMRACVRRPFLKLVLSGRRVAFKDKRDLGVVGLSPHPNPLPVGEGDKSTLVRSAS
jgi:hypothetical protein